MWLYECQLSEYVPAAELETAWTDETGVGTGPLGVNVAGTVAVIAASARVSGADASVHPAVQTLTETRELTSPTQGEALDTQGRITFSGGPS